MTKYSRSMISSVAVATMLLAACGDDPSGPIDGAGDLENISRVTVTLTPVGGGTDVTSSRFDPDGTQLPRPVGTATGTLALRAGVTYAGVVTLRNDLDPNDVLDISDEVNEESNFHRFFYTASCTGVSAPVSGQNRDTQNPSQPFGGQFQVVVAANAPTSSSCTLTVELRHFETNKGDGAGQNFDTDLDIDFPVTITP